MKRLESGNITKENIDDLSRILLSMVDDSDIPNNVSTESTSEDLVDKTNGYNGGMRERLEYLIYIQAAFGMESNNEVYLTNSAIFLSSALFDIKTEIGKGSDILSEGYLFSLLPPDPNLRLLTPVLGDPSTEDIIFGSIEQLLQGIETNLAILDESYGYVSFKTEEVKIFAEELAEKINKYSKYGEAILKNVSGIDRFKAMQLEEVFQLYKNFKAEDIISLSDVDARDILFKAHGSLYNLNLDGDMWPLFNKSGEDISTQIALLYYIDASRNIIKDEKKNKSNLITNKGKYYIERKEFTEIFSKDLDQIDKILALTATLKENDKVLDHFYSNARAPLTRFERVLELIGIHSVDATKIADELRERYTTITPREKNLTNILQGYKDFDYEEWGEKLHKGVRSIVYHTTGVIPTPTTLQFVKPEEINPLAQHIAPIVYVSGMEGGTPKFFHEEGSMIETTILENLVKRLYPNNDVYVRTNIGACIILDINNRTELVSPKTSIIEFRDELPYDSWKLHHWINTGHVLIHEVDHSAQIEKKTMKLACAAHVGYYLGSMALEHFDLLDSKYDIMKVNENLDENFVEIIKQFVYPLLAKKGDSSISLDSISQKGMLSYLASNNMFKVKDGRLDVEQYNNIELWDSNTTNAVKGLEESILDKDKEKISNYVTLLKEHADEMTEIIETVAESFSLYGQEQMIKTSINDYVLEQQSHLRNHMMRQGEMGKKYIEIIQSFPKEKIEEELRKNNMTYQQFLFDNNQEQVQELIKKGAHPLDPFAHKDTLLPVNLSWALLQVRYRKNIPVIDEIRRNSNGPITFNETMHTENWQEVYALLKNQ